jgi:hypothetical protein
MSTNGSNSSALSLAAQPPISAIYESATRTICYSLSRAWLEKEPIYPDASYAWIWSRSFSPNCNDITGLYEHICNGLKFTPCAYKPHSRGEDTFVSGDLLVLDFDGGNHDLSVLRSHQLISKAAIIYATPSWSPEAKRWRAVFVLPYTLTIEQDWRYAATGLYLRCSNLAGIDPASRKPAQPYAGSLKARVVSDFQPERTLSELDLNYLIALGTPPPPPPMPPVRQSETWDAFLSDLDAALKHWGVRRYNAKGFSNAIRCPMKNHENDHRSPAATWNHITHSLTCHKCQLSWNAKSTGEALGVEYRK